MIEREDIVRAATEELAAMEMGCGIGSGFGGGGKEDGANAESGIEGCGGLFLVDVKMAGDEVEVAIDSDARGAGGRLRGVSVEDCVRLTKAIEARFDRDEDDFSLTVSSAGIGQPLKTMRQYRKLVGSSVEVVLKDGGKIVAVLEAMEEAGITLSYPEKRKVEGQKRPEIVTVTRTFPLAEVKATKEYIDFK